MKRIIAIAIAVMALFIPNIPLRLLVLAMAAALFLASINKNKRKTGLTSGSGSNSSNRVEAVVCYKALAEDSDKNSDEAASKAPLIGEELIEKVQEMGHGRQAALEKYLEKSDGNTLGLACNLGDLSQSDLDYLGDIFASRKEEVFFETWGESIEEYGDTYEISLNDTLNCDFAEKDSRLMEIRRIVFALDDQLQATALSTVPSKRLEGSELLGRVKLLGDIGRLDLMKGCGYVSQSDLDFAQEIVSKNKESIYRMLDMRMPGASDWFDLDADYILDDPEVLLSILGQADMQRVDEIKDKSSCFYKALLQAKGVNTENNEAPTDDKEKEMLSGIESTFEYIWKKRPGITLVGTGKNPTYNAIYTLVLHDHTKDWMTLNKFALYVEKLTPKGAKYHSHYDRWTRSTINASDGVSCLVSLEYFFDEHCEAVNAVSLHYTCLLGEGRLNRDDEQCLMQAINDYCSYAQEQGYKNASLEFAEEPYLDHPSVKYCVIVNHSLHKTGSSGSEVKVLQDLASEAISGAELRLFWDPSMWPESAKGTAPQIKRLEILQDGFERTPGLSPGPCGPVIRYYLDGPIEDTTYFLNCIKDSSVSFKVESLSEEVEFEDFNGYLQVCQHPEDFVETESIFTRDYPTGMPVGGDLINCSRYINP